jgi:hypothetical protein
LRCVYDLAATSVGLRDATAALQLSLRLFVEQLEELETQDEQVRLALTDTFLELPEAPYLLSVPAFGLITAATVLAEIGDPRNYQRAAQLIKLAGTQPVPNTTGRKTRSKTPMSHKGRSRLRTVLFFAVLRLVQVDPVFAACYEHYQHQNAGIGRADEQALAHSVGVDERPGLLQCSFRANRLIISVPSQEARFLSCRRELLDRRRGDAVPRTLRR